MTGSSLSPDSTLQAELQLVVRLLAQTWSPIDGLDELVEQIGRAAAQSARALIDGPRFARHCATMAQDRIDVLRMQLPDVGRAIFREHDAVARLLDGVGWEAMDALHEAARTVDALPRERSRLQLPGAIVERFPSIVLARPLRQASGDALGQPLAVRELCERLALIAVDLPWGETSPRHAFLVDAIFDHACDVSRQLNTRRLISEIERMVETVLPSPLLIVEEDFILPRSALMQFLVERTEPSPGLDAFLQAIEFERHLDSLSEVELQALEAAPDAPEHIARVAAAIAEMASQEPARREASALRLQQLLDDEAGGDRL